MVMIVADVRYGLRMLVKSPGFTAVALLILALGIGVNCANFSVLNDVFLRPPPVVKDPGCLVALGRTLDDRSFEGFAHLDYLEYRNRNHVFSGLIAYEGASLSLTGGGEAEMIDATLVTGNYFSVLGINPVRGRAFLPEEGQVPGSHPVVVISYELWIRRFGSDPSLVGKILILNGHSFTVVGIAPKGFKGVDLLDSPDIWMPLMMEEQARPLFPTLNSRLFSSLKAVGRLKPGCSIEQAQAEMTALSHTLEEIDPVSKKQRNVVVTPDIRFTEPDWRADARKLLTLLMTVSGLVLVIACANVANLLLVRFAVRKKEIAVRLALGASRIHLARQFLTESLLLSLFGAALGVLVGIWMTRLPQAFLGPHFDFGLDRRVLGFTLVTSLLIGFILGVVPALRASTSNLVNALKHGLTGHGHHDSRLRNLFVVLQLALSLVLVILAGLFVRTVHNLQSINLGFETNNILVVPLNLRLLGYPESKTRILQRQLVEHLAVLPGVQSASMANDLPVRGEFSDTRDILIEGQSPTPDGGGIPVDYDDVEPRYFDTLRIPLLRGRDFRNEDHQDSPGVAIINEAMAHRFWPSEDPIGRRLRLVHFMGPLSPYLEVIAVAGNTRYRRLEQRPASHLYLPLSQDFQMEVTLLVRTAADSNGMRRALRVAVATTDRNLPVSAVRTLADHILDSDGEERMTASLVSLFGLLALVIAAIGLYGLMSYTVAQRTQEIGVRMALGAERRNVLGLIIRQGFLLALAGVVVGMIAAFVLARVISSRLYGVGAIDLLTFVCASILLTLVAFLASYIPARRAVRVDPMVTLRYE
jgi:predicted permease